MMFSDYTEEAAESLVPICPYGTPNKKTKSPKPTRVSHFSLRVKWPFASMMEHKFYFSGGSRTTNKFTDHQFGSSLIFSFFFYPSILNCIQLS